MIYPNRRPLLISAILVALTAVPTMIVVAAGTASLHQRDRSQSPAVAGPPAGPVIVGPGSTGKVRELPRATGRAVEPLPLDRRSSGSARDFGVFSRTGARPEATVAPPAPAPVVGSSGPAEPPAPASPPPTERDCPRSPTPSTSTSTSPGPRMDDRAWPGWDRNFHPESGRASG